MNTNNYYDYGVFTPLLTGQPVIIKTSDITSTTIDDYQNNLKDIFLDYIENENIQNSKITFIFDNGMQVILPVAYALINIIVWGFVIKTNQTIKPYHVFFRKEGITNSYIKEYIDKYAIMPVRELISINNDKMTIHNLNRVIYDSLRDLKFVDKFAWYLIMRILFLCIIIVLDLKKLWIDIIIIIILNFLQSK